MFMDCRHAHTYSTPAPSATIPGRHATRPPPAGRRPSLKLQDWGLVKLPSVEDRGQTDRVATPTSAGLHRFRWPRPRQLATDGVTVKTYYYSLDAAVDIHVAHVLHCPSTFDLQPATAMAHKKGKSSLYSITERRVRS